MSKIVLFVLAAVLATALSFPAVPEQETPLSRMVREAAPEPHHKHGFGGFGGYGGYGYGGGYGGYGHGYGHGPGYGHGGYGYPYGGYPIGGYGGGSSHSVAHAGSISSPFGSASFASAKAGGIGYGR